MVLKIISLLRTNESVQCKQQYLTDYGWLLYYRYDRFNWIKSHMFSRTRFMIHAYLYAIKIYMHSFNRDILVFYRNVRTESSISLTVHIYWDGWQPYLKVDILGLHFFVTLNDTNTQYLLLFNSYRTTYLWFWNILLFSKKEKN